MKSDGELETNTSSNVYNDDKWHKIEITRIGKIYSVKIDLNDNVTEEMTGKSKGTMDDFQVCIKFFKLILMKRRVFIHFIKVVLPSLKNIARVIYYAE